MHSVTADEAVEAPESPPALSVASDDSDADPLDSVLYFPEYGTATLPEQLASVRELMEIGACVSHLATCEACRALVGRCRMGCPLPPKGACFVSSTKKKGIRQREKRQRASAAKSGTDSPPLATVPPVDAKPKTPPLQPKSKAARSTNWRVKDPPDEPVPKPPLPNVCCELCKHNGHTKEACRVNLDFYCNRCQVSGHSEGRCHALKPVHNAATKIDPDDWMAPRRVADVV